MVVRRRALRALLGYAGGGLDKSHSAAAPLRRPVPGGGLGGSPPPAPVAEAVRQLPTVASGRYRAFRSVTAYGDPRRQPAPADVLAWLRWARSFRRACTRRG